MYLLRLFVDTGTNPDRPQPGRLLLRNLYHVHQRLCMTFPSEDRKDKDADFLAPYEPDDFAKQVHVIRGNDAGFLFRIEPKPDGRAVILVQSAVKPDWEYAFHNAGYLLAARPDVKVFEPCHEKGQRLQFRLLANPTRRLSKHSLGADGQPIDAKDVGKRVPVRDEHLFDWLARQGESSGFIVERYDVVTQTGYVYFDKKQDDSKLGKSQNGRLRSVRYDGILTVSDPDKFQAAILQGIGSGRGFGFGLLSVAPA